MNTTEKIYFDANDIAQLLGTSQGFAYKLIRSLNKELEGNRIKNHWRWIRLST